MIKTLVISDFNAEFVSRYLSADQAAPICHAVTTPYGQVFQTLAGSPEAGQEVVAFIWTRPQGVIAEYQKLLDGLAFDMNRLLTEVDAYAAAIAAYAAKCRLVFVGSWVSSANGRGLGMLDWTTDGHAYCLARMNGRLADALAKIQSVFLLDSQRWLDGKPGRDEKYWLTLKCPFTEATCQSAALDVKAAIRGATGLARKLIIVDLDNTLWGGEVGEQGWEGLTLGGHDPAGEAYVEFQSALKVLGRRGIALAVASKNDETIALEAIDRHPEMILRRDDFVAWRINWKDKAQNIVELAEELNLGLQSAVFIDDSPIERGRIKEALPDILVPDWPKDVTRFAEAMRQLDYFDQAAITTEDRARVRMYTEERARKETLMTVSSVDEWLGSLGIQIGIEPVQQTNIKRSVQLLNKTNQMNLRSRRLSEVEMINWLSDHKDRTALVLRVTDRFGDIGQTGLVSWQCVGDDIEIVDYVLSCRAMGRKVEDLMVSLAVDAARTMKKSRIVATLDPTARNQPCADFWRNSGFIELEHNKFVWDATKPYPRPDFMKVALGVY
jgi:FkbH-like protein